MTNDTIPALLAPAAKPDPKSFLYEIRQAVMDANWFQQTMRSNDDLRTCYWPGQTADGKKHGTVNAPARPWENAADHRVHLLQEVMNERTVVRRQAMKRARTTIKGRTVDDQARAALLKQVVDYYLRTEMGAEVENETTLWSNWSQGFGHSVMQVGWQTERQLEERPLSVQMLKQAHAASSVAEAETSAAQAGQELDELAAAEIAGNAYLEVEEWLMSEDSGGLLRLLDLVMLLDEDVAEMGVAGRSEVMRALKRLKRREETTYQAPFVKRSAPCWEALQPYVDVFYPTETRKLPEARWIARVRWLDEVALRSWAASEELDESWLREVLKHPGKCLDLTGLSEWVLSAVTTRMSTRQPPSWSDGTQGAKYYQVLEVYWRAFTPFQVPVVYRTIAHGKVPTGFGKHEVCKAYHGKYPFFDLREERWGRMLLESRGVPEIFGTYQSAVKAQWDGRTNTASLTNCPPMTGPAGSSPPVIGPGVYVESYRSGKVEWMQTPPPDNRSIEIENTIVGRLNRFYGRMSPEVPEALQILMQGDLGDGMLTAVSGVLGMTVQLIQQYTPDLKGRRITGTDAYVTATREEIQGMFDIEVAWDARDLSLEWVEQKLEFYQKLLLPLDNRGLINRAELIRVGAEAVDPLSAERFVQDDDTLSRREKEEELAALSEIFSGRGPVDFVVGVDHGARAQVMQEDLAQSPVRQQMMAGNPMVAQVWEDRLQKHLFQLEQEQNRTTGIEGGSDPLRQSPLAQLKAGGWQAMVGGFFDGSL